MEKYKVFYENEEIGVLEINEKGQYKYTPNSEGVKNVKSSISLFYELLEESDWREPIPILKNRIEDAKRFSEENYISNQTDKLKLVKD